MLNSTLGRVVRLVAKLGERRNRIVDLLGARKPNGVPEHATRPSGAGTTVLVAEKHDYDTPAGFWGDADAEHWTHIRQRGWGGDQFSNPEGDGPRLPRPSAYGLVLNVTLRVGSSNSV